jgi:hypothetical protein
MRFIELELEEVRELGEVTPPLRAPGAMACPQDGTIFVCDQPGDGPPRLLRWTRGRPSEVSLDAPGFLPRFLVDAGDERVLAVGRGENSGVLFDLRGRVVQRYNLGEGIADATYDPDGNIVVLRGGRPLLDRYGPDGDLSEGDPQLERIAEQTSVESGDMLLIQRDAGLWLNLEELYDGEGEEVRRLDAEDVFGAGWVSADLLGDDGVIALTEDGRLVAVAARSAPREVRLPEDDLRRELGRGPSAATDLLVTRGERLLLLDPSQARLLAFRILSE